jgi:hypothetical protein
MSMYKKGQRKEVMFDELATEMIRACDPLRRSIEL